ncbi:hypothetical protein NOR53_3077 [gamma proteobacterium NOR5-3]|nr:hypothetical protein NOR53_3077 [gamma proteobacterium NOR5-3]
MRLFQRFHATRLPAGTTDIKFNDTKLGDISLLVWFLLMQ